MEKLPQHTRDQAESKKEPAKEATPVLKFSRDTKELLDLSKKIDPIHKLKFNTQEMAVFQDLLLLKVKKDPEPILSISDDITNVIEATTRVNVFGRSSFSTYYRKPKFETFIRRGSIGENVSLWTNDLSSLAFEVACTGLSNLSQDDISKLSAGETGKLMALSWKIIESSCNPVFIESVAVFRDKVYQNDKKLRDAGQLLPESNTDSRIKELEDKIFEQRFASSIQLHYDLFRKPEHKNVVARLKEILAKFGLNTEKTIESWFTVGRNNESDNLIGMAEEKAPHIYDNITNIQKIEELRRGSVKFLYENFGIRNFCRYTPKMLVQQIKDINKQTPYGIIVGPIDDWNGAYSNHTVREVWAEMNKGLAEAGHKVRIIECGSKIDLARNLIKLDRKYGKKNKISFSVLSGHGSKDGIDLGTVVGLTINPTSLNEFHAKDLEGKGVERAKKFFIKRPTIIFDSCSTGAYGGGWSKNV